MEAFSKYLLLYCLVCLWANAEFEVTSADPLQTNGPETNYVENVSDNEHCFHNNHDDVDKLPCPKGRRRARERGESSCLPCPFEVGGLQTFQPKQNDCDKCIRCSECGEGEEISSNCSRVEDTKCQPVEHQVSSSTTGEISKADVTTLPTERTTMETKHKNRGTPTGCPGVGMSNIEPNRSESCLWWMTIVICILSVTLSVIISYWLWTNRKDIPCLVRRAVTWLSCTCNPCGDAADGGPAGDGGEAGAADATDNQTSNSGSGDHVQNDATTVNKTPVNSDESGEATENDTPGSVALPVDTAGTATNQEVIFLEELGKRHEGDASDNGAEVDSATNTGKDPVEKGTEEECKHLLNDTTEHVNNDGKKE